VLAIFATLFGSAASLGLGALQIDGGLKAGGYLDNAGTALLVVVIAVLTVAFVASAVSGVATDGGPDRRQRGDAMEAWLSGWTVFYWAWWISWTPFVGMFIARISRGRTIKQFVTGVILIPSLVSLLWFAIFGGAAVSLQRSGVDLAARSPEGQLFGVLDAYPLGVVLGVVAMLLVAIFFVSGADAASVVMGTLSQRVSVRPSRGVVIFWGVLMGTIGAVMLLVGGGGDAALSGIQKLTIITAAPFAVIMVLMCVALAEELRNDPLVHRDDRTREKVTRASSTAPPATASTSTCASNRRTATDPASGTWSPRTTRRSRQRGSTDQPVVGWLAASAQRFDVRRKLGRSARDRVAS
jgi:choline-glycine betaine transporter